MTVTIGIDPGAHGAAALLVDGEYEDVIDFDSGDSVPERLVLWDTLYGVDLVLLEQVHAGGARTGGNGRPVMGAKSAHTFFTNYGWCKGLLDMGGFVWREMTPLQWMPGLVPKRKALRDKPGLTVARRMFPAAPLHLAKHHNRADAVLLAYRAHLILKEN